MKKLLTLLFSTIIFLGLANNAFAQSSSSKTTKVGNPPVAQACWPTNGTITQGPQGATSHARIASGSNGFAIDVGNTEGTPVHSTFNGTVKVYDCAGKGVCDGGYGNLVKIIPDGNPNALVYNGHLSVISVSDGAAIKAGDKIGLMGQTGYAFGSHLHYEFRGLQMATPNIPENITPTNCDENCSPTTISIGACTAPASESAQDDYWFVLHRQSMREELYQGVPGDKTKSLLIKTFQVRPGKPGERPTPLPQLAGRQYWLIDTKFSSSGSVGPYFLRLNIPYTNSAPYGPEPYNECNGSQCNWKTPGDFGLHGTGGDRTRVQSDGSRDDNWSSGCVRHFDEDITYLYNLLNPDSNPIRYYVEDN